MSDERSYAITLRLVSDLRAYDSWCGETHLQKSMHFLEELGRTSNGFKFILYKHGPYSFDFHDHLDELRGLGLVDLEIIPPYGPRYRVTAKGERLMEDQGKILAPFVPAIRETARCLGSKKVKELEKLGTALLVRSEMQEESITSRAKRLHDLKPHVPLPDAKEATRELDELVRCFAQKQAA